MTRYVTPLPGLLARTAESVLNRLIELDPGAPALIGAMGDKMLQVHFEQVGIDLFFRGTGASLTVCAETPKTPATTISGTPLALMAMASPGNKSPGDDVTISGNAELARRFEQMIRRLDPDWEAALSEHFGDFLGHQLHTFFRQGRQAARHSATVGTEQMGAWLGEESGLLVNRPEFEAFTREVDTLRESVDRFAQVKNRK